MSTEDKAKALVLRLCESIISYTALLWEYLKVNLKGEMEFRASFVSQVTFMVMNNAFGLFFWLVFFARFSDIKGWQAQDVLLLWAVGASSFGLVNGICGNAMRLHRLIADGQLDYYLAHPKNTLFQLLVSKMSPSAWGDFLTGVIIGIFVLDGIGEWGLYLLLLFMSGAVLLAFCISVGSIAFWTGSAEGIFSSAINALISFTLYPDTLFTGVIKAILFTAIPAAFITYIPVSLLREFDLTKLLLMVGAVLTASTLAGIIYKKGLKRYESGNLMMMRM